MFLLRPKDRFRWWAFPFSCDMRFEMLLYSLISKALVFPVRTTKMHQISMGITMSRLAGEETQAHADGHSEEEEQVEDVDSLPDGLKPNELMKCPIEENSDASGIHGK